MKKAASLLLIATAALLAACGGKSASEAQPAAASASQAPAAQAAAENEGVLLAKEILGLFDQAVAEAAGLIKDKPEAAELKPKLDALYAAYEAKMTAINPRYRALKAKDVALFGAANTYLGENRGRHVFEKDNKLGEGMAYYNIQKGEKDIVEFLSLKLPALIDAAVKM